MPDLTFYHCPRTCSLASYAALEEAGLPFTPRLIDLRSADEVTAFRLLNPAGTVPALSIDGRVIRENVAILSYAALAAPEAELMPTDPEGVARCLSVLAWMSSTVHITRRMNTAPFRFVADEYAQQELRAAGHERFWENLQRIDALAVDGWLLGPRFSIADCYALAFYDWGVRDHYPMRDLGNFSRLVDEAKARPAVARALVAERSRLADR